MHESKPFFGVQFHPEVSPGPTDTEVCRKDEAHYRLKKKSIFKSIYMRTQETKIITLDDPGTEHSRRVL